MAATVLGRVSTALWPLFLAAVLVPLGFALFHVLEWRGEARLLDRVAGYIGHRESPAQTVDAVVRWADLALPRQPGEQDLFRDSALRAIETGEGDCGAGARIAVLVLNRLGIDAYRLIVPKYGHVAVAWRGEAGLRISPGARKPEAWPFENHIALKDAFRMEWHGTAYVENGGYSFFNGARILPNMEIRVFTPPPHWLAVLLESPDLIKAALWSFAALVMAAFFKRPES